jgi:hypothetical protein
MSPELRAEVERDHADWLAPLVIALEAVTAPIRVKPVPGQYRPCEMRGHCG